MKKFLAILGVFATIFAFAACDKEKEEPPTVTDEFGSVSYVKTTMSPEQLSELHASQEANRIEESKAVEASIRQEEEIYEEKLDTLEALGKTEKNKQIVFMSSGQYPGMKEGFEVIKFDDEGKFESWIRYIYYPSTEAFNRAVSDIKDDKHFAYETSNAASRVIVYRMVNETRIKDYRTLSYDQLLNNVRSFGFGIVE